jgi:UPF0716 protein FxsA
MSPKSTSGGHNKSVWERNMPVLLVLLAVPIIEIALFVVIGGEIGVLATLAWVMGSAAIGLALMRREPQRSAADVRTALASDVSPASPMAHSALRMMGAVLLALPGFLTDAFGLLLLIAPLRAMVLAVLLPRVILRSRTMRSDIIDGDYTQADDMPPDPQTRRFPPENRD